MATVSASTKLIKLALTLSTTGSFLPSLNIIISRARHFECFIGSLQLFTAVCYSISDSLSCRILGVDAGAFHLVCDICTETYVCLMCLHLCGLRSQNRLHFLRYLSFVMCWFAKLGDGWQSVFLEVVVLALFVLPPTLLMLYSCVFRLLGGVKPKLKPTHSPPPPSYSSSPVSFSASDVPFPFDLFFGDRPLPYSKLYFGRALSAVFAGVLLLVLELKHDGDYKIFNALAHCSFGLSSYYLWQLLPCCDKEDFLPSFR